jgi:hypothetical protein
MLAVGSCGHTRSGGSPSVDAGEDHVPRDALPEAVARETGTQDSMSDVSTSSGFSATDPVWGDSFATSVCTVQRLANPTELQAFQWVPCDGIDGCEEATLNTRVFNATNAAGKLLMPRGSTSDDAQTVIGLVGPPGILATESGQVLDGYALSSQSSNCLMLSVSLWKARFGLTFADTSKDNYSTLLGTLGSAASPTVSALVPNTTGVPEADRLGDTRWVWTWNQPTRQFSFSAADASDFLQFAGPTDTVLDMAHAVSAGSQFLIDTELTTGSMIAASDGVTAPIAYVAPSDGSWAYSVGFAHSYVAWQRGVNPSSPDNFQTVELWASPYDPDPSKLSPVLIADLGWHHLDNGYAGYGHYVIPTIDVATNTATGIASWNLETRTQRVYAFPPDYRWRYPIGVTRKYFWVVDVPPHLLRRFALD